MSLSDNATEPTNASPVDLYSLNVDTDNKILFGYGCGADIASQLSVIYSKTVMGTILA